MAPVVIRKSEPADVSAVTKIYQDEKVIAGTLQLPIPSEAMWQKRLENLDQHAYSFVAEMDQQLCGHLAFFVDSKPRRRHVASFGMGVLEQFQGKGVGSALLAAAIDHADNWLNIQRIEITAYTDNQTAIGLYKKFGFEIEGESKKYAFRNGQYVSAYHMARFRPENMD
ncbi:GNAT family N-acetyltransferase [Pelagibaculum spongiae]|uniref:GNAT family N-acetyltransferase n=1 Tax=Pelagibaculum spongiae TaxID=2080658 RepID=A0A2V1H1T7_9GAMM|nr:GNAT family N-acetyltransferase [Pelagibaculum spongiae]PVZ68846.1 GNAT family N-acetyltransferase [Pelagibaculum spongiae]